MRKQVVETGSLRRLGRWLLLLGLLLPAASAAQELRAGGAVTLVARIPETLSLQAQMAPLPPQVQTQLAAQNLHGSAVVLGGRFLFANGQSYSVHASLHPATPHPAADSPIRAERISAGMLLEMPLAGVATGASPTGMAMSLLPAAAPSRVQILAAPNRNQLSGLLVLLPAESGRSGSSPGAELRITATAM